MSTGKSEPGGDFWQKRGLYVLGALLVYIGVSWSTAIGYSSISEIRWTIGPVLGPIIATPLALLHIGIQWLMRKSARRFATLSPWREALALNLPVALLMCFWVVSAYRGTAAMPVFERFVAQPIPPSVQIISHGGGKVNFAEGVRVGIWFEIEPVQLSELVRAGGFATTSDTRGVEYWKGQFRHHARLDVPLAEPYTVHFRESRPRTNSTQIIYADVRTNIVTSVSYDVDEYLFCPSNSLSVFYLRLSR